MYNDITWRDLQNELVCLDNSAHVAKYAKKFSSTHWSFLGPGSENKSNATDTFKPGGEWDRVAKLMMLNLSESVNPFFVGPLHWNEELRKRGGKLSIHFRWDYVNVELIFRSTVSVNQLSIYGAVANLWEDFVPPITSTGRPVTLEKPESTVYPMIC